MALFGRLRDVNFFKRISKELLENVISTQCGYYKVVLNKTNINSYGEATDKSFIGPVLIFCLIDKGDTNSKNDGNTLDITRELTFKFLKDHLVSANVVPEVGDIIFFNENYFEVDNVNENQLVLGKDNEYAYSEGLENFGGSFSIICSTHLTSPDRLGIAKQRI